MHVCLCGHLNIVLKLVFYFFASLISKQALASCPEITTPARVPMQRCAEMFLFIWSGVINSNQISFRSLFGLLLAYSIERLLNMESITMII